MDSTSINESFNESIIAASGPTRRQVLSGVGVGVGAAALASVLAPAARAADALGALAAGPIRRSTDIGAEWKFVLVNADDITDPTGAYANAPDPGFDDSGWRTVDLPHDWSIERPPVQRANTSSSSGFFQGGLGWYRKTFTLPPAVAGKRVSIEFDGVYSNSFVYVNGHLLGNHPYAYTGFHYDITGHVHTDGVTANVIAVQAQNPLPSSRWYSGSGIYRNVHLIVTDPVHVARSGTFVTTPDLATTIGAGYANVRVDTQVANDTASSAAAEVRTTVSDASGRVVAHGATPLAVPGGATGTGTITMRLTHPTLWSTDNPHLYRLRTDIVVAGHPADTTTTTFGLRYTAFDPNAGFSLNGRPTKLYGVDLHATQGPLGAVINADALERQMRLMRSMGVNALRTAHNPPAPELVGVCERLGIVMMVEAFDCWHTGKVAFDYHVYFDQWSQSDITEMVNAHRNSPAVVLWSIGNETPDTGLPAGPAIAGRLIAAVRAADPTRPIVMGSDRYRSVPKPGSPADQILRQLDGLGLNYNTAMSIDGLHAAYPDKFFFESESSSETSTRGVYQEPQLLNTGENYTPGRRATSSYDNNLASWTMSGEYSLKKDRDRQFFLGQFLWSGQDYIGEPTPYDVFPVKASFFGATDTAGLPKDAFHLFRSQWSAEPMVHITPMDWTNHEPGEDVPIWVYANVQTVELLLNGVSLRPAVPGDHRADRGRPELPVRQLHQPERRHRQAAPDLDRAVPARPAGRGRDRQRAAGRPRRTRHGRHAARHLPGAQPAWRIDVVPDHVHCGQARRCGARCREHHPVRRHRPWPARRCRQRPAGKPAGLPGTGRARVQRYGGGRHRGNRITGHHHRDGDLAGPGIGKNDTAGQRRRTAQRPRHTGERHDGRHAARRCKLLGRAGHRAGRDAGRRSHDGMVELLRQVGDRDTECGQPVPAAGLGLAVLACGAHGQRRLRVVHHQHQVQPAGHHRGQLPHRQWLRAGRQPAHHLGHRVGPADHTHLRFGAHRSDPAHDDQPDTGHRGRFPPDQ